MSRDVVFYIKPLKWREISPPAIEWPSLNYAATVANLEYEIEFFEGCWALYCYHHESRERYLSLEECKLAAENDMEACVLPFLEPYDFGDTLGEDQ